MMISTKGRYALRTMIDLAQHRGEHYVSLRDISLRQDISMKYLEQIVGQLNRAGLLQSSRGAAGGYKLARLPEEYTAGDILRLTEGALAPVACLSPESGPCARCGECLTVDFWQGLYQAINQYVDSVTLAQLARTGLSDEPAPAAKPAPKQKAQPAVPAKEPPTRKPARDIPIELL